MPHTIETGIILIKEGTLLPEALRLESEPFAPGWRLVKDLDGYGLDRRIQEAGWTFFCLAGEIKATVLGLDGQKTVRRAVKRILGKLKSEKFNSLEITAVASKRFLGVPYASVSARSRHIQESMFLFRAKDHQKWGPSKMGGRLAEVTGLTSGEEPRQEEMITQLHVATILNL
ncbi:MAG TPA: hypothetical protein VHM88_27610 [Candidatus Acidoferrales bacterium]|jgi:hypothetical protein|nr:hypothetical protein [Candidatus Acidoferrales bacterium]